MKSCARKITCVLQCSALQCVAARCNVLQCVVERCSIHPHELSRVESEMCCSVCVAVRCSALQRVAVRCRALQFFVASDPTIFCGWKGKYCSVLQCVAVCCSVFR